MKNFIVFLGVTITVSIFTWLLVGILIGAPEVGEKTPMTLVQNIASILMLITFLPGLLIKYVLYALGWNLPAASFIPLVICNAVVWAVLILLVVNRVKRKLSLLRPK
jgi:hypothetical protein